VTAVEELRALGWSIGDQAVVQGLAQVQWPARLEIMGRRPLVLLDCAHNVASAQALVSALEAALPARGAAERRFLIFAGSGDKDLEGMLHVLASRFDHVALTRFSASPRSAAPEQLAEFMPPGTSFEVFANAPEAWLKMRERAAERDLICVTGSVYLAGELRPLLAAR